MQIKSTTTTIDPDVLNLLQRVKEVSERYEAEVPLSAIPVHILSIMCGQKVDIPTLNDPTLKNEVSAESLEESKGLAGLSETNIYDILKYAKMGLELPTDLEGTKKFIGYDGTSEIWRSSETFAPERFNEIFIANHKQAAEWNSIEKQILEVGDSINIYGDQFVSYSNLILSEIDKMPLSQRVGDTEVELTQEDKSILINLSTILDTWKEDTETYKEKTDAVYDKIKAYDDTLTNILLPPIEEMASNLAKLDIKGEESKLRGEISELDTEITVLEAKYKEYVGLAFSGAGGMGIFPPLGILTWGVTGGVYGAKAEKVRKQKNKKKEEREKLQKKLDDLSSIDNTVGNLKNNSTTFKDALVDTMLGLDHLIVFWNTIDGYINAANERLNKVNSKSTLGTFKLQISLANTSWLKVPDMARYLLELFDEAKKELYRSKADSVMSEKIN